MPDIANVASSHHGQLGIALGERAQFQQLRLPPIIDELAVLWRPITICRRWKAPHGECLIDVENELDVAALDELEDSLAACPFNLDNLVERRIRRDFQDLGAMELG